MQLLTLAYIIVLGVLIYIAYLLIKLFLHDVNEIKSER